MSNSANSQFGSAPRTPFSFGQQSSPFNQTNAYTGARDNAMQQLLMMPRFQAGLPGLFGRAGSSMSYGGPPSPGATQGIREMAGMPGARITGNIMDPWYGPNPNWPPQNGGMSPPPNPSFTEANQTGGMSPIPQAPTFSQYGAPTGDPYSAFTKFSQMPQQFDPALMQNYGNVAGFGLR